MNDRLSHIPIGIAPPFRDRAPHSAPSGDTEYIKSAAELHARRREQERLAALRAEADAKAQDAIASEAVTKPPAAASLRRQTGSTAKPQGNRPSLSPEQRAAERALFRHGCGWLQLHLMCAKSSCRKSGGCRGEPVACFRAAMPHVPETARQFVRAMLEGQELGLSFEEAMEDAEDLQAGWEGWIAGLEAAAKARVKKAR
jgi:hypothetical protein